MIIRTIVIAAQCDVRGRLFVAAEVLAPSRSSEDNITCV